MFSPRFAACDSGFVPKQCVGFFNQLVGEKPSDLRIRVPPPTKNFDGLHVLVSTSIPLPSAYVQGSYLSS
jgi:hypothetical protein